MQTTTERIAAELRRRAPGLTAYLRTLGTGRQTSTDRRAHPRLRTVLTRYLVISAAILALVLAFGPGLHDAENRETWQYEHDQVHLEGGGALNAYARTTMRLTAWVTAGSIDRVRSLHERNLLNSAAGMPAAAQVGGWEAGHNPALRTFTQVTMLALVAYGMVRRPQRRTWVVAILLLLVAAVAITRPSAVTDATGTAGTAVPQLMLGTFAQVDPGTPPGEERTGQEAQQRLADEYWTSFVAYPLSRLQTGTPVLAEVESEKRQGVLDSLAGQVTAVNDWAVGERGWERSFVATTALLYALPFALVVIVLAMVATAAQSTLFLLLLVGLVALPLAVEPQRRPRIMRLWLLPTLTSTVVLALASLAALLVLRLAETIHSADEYVGLLLTGAVWPVAMVVLVTWQIRRRRRRRMDKRHPPAAPDLDTPAPEEPAYVRVRPTATGQPDEQLVPTRTGQARTERVRGDESTVRPTAEGSVRAASGDG